MMSQAGGVVPDLGPRGVGLTRGSTASWRGLGPNPVQPYCTVFNGTSDFLSSAAALTLSDVNNLAMSFWLYTTFAADDDIVLEYSVDSNSNAGTFKVIANESGTNTFWVDLNGNVGKNGRHCTAPSNSVWHHVIVNLDMTVVGGSGEEVAAIFIDGVSQSLTLNSSQVFNNTGTFADQTLYVMSRAGTGLFADGRICDLRIYPGRQITPYEAGGMYDPKTRWALYEQPQRLVVKAAAAATVPTLPLINDCFPVASRNEYVSV